MTVTDKRSTTERGYGGDHQALRRLWAVIVAEGRARCCRCGRPIQPGARWDLDHTDDRSRYLGPSHARCNRSAGGRKGNIRRRLARIAGRETQLRW